jgi:hypothetical protein
MINEPTSDNYTDMLLLAYLESNNFDLNATASQVWGEKASGYVDLVDVTEAGASRKLSQLWERATKQQTHYAGQVGGAVGAAGSPTTRPIERA